MAELNGPEVAAENSIEHPRRVDVRERWETTGGWEFSHTFPAHSISVLR